MEYQTTMFTAAVLLSMQDTPSLRRLVWDSHIFT